MTHRELHQINIQRQNGVHAIAGTLLALTDSMLAFAPFTSAVAPKNVHAGLLSLASKHTGAERFSAFKVSIGPINEADPHKCLKTSAAEINARGSMMGIIDFLSWVPKKGMSCHCHTWDWLAWRRLRKQKRPPSRNGLSQVCL